MSSTAVGMRWARALAVVVIVGVGAAAFVLSFTTLRDLAMLAHIPVSTAWLFPLIVDGTIIQATLGWLVLAASPQRRYFVWVLAAGALISVAGNSIHAVAAGRVLPGWVCAIVAAIAPISLLIDTHGLAVLFRAHHTPESTAAVVESTESTADSAAGVDVDSTVESTLSATPGSSGDVAEPVALRPRAAQPVSMSSRPAASLLPVSVPVGS